MKGISYSRFGGSEVLEYGDLPEPKLSQNAVIVRMKAAAINPADIALQAGLGESMMETWFPVVPGWDLAGIVERVGAGVTEFQPGDEVVAYTHQEILHSGTYAELASVPVERLWRKPRNASWSEAAGLPLAGLTAYRAVIDTLRVSDADTVLVLGASGGVGSMATQLAVASGATVIGSASGPHQAYVTSIGAEPVLYGDGIVERVRNHAPNGVTAIMDCAGHGALAKAMAAAAPGARLCSIADGGPGVTTVFARPDTKILARLVDLVEAGSLRVTVAASFALADAADAQEALKARTYGPGKIILVPAAA
ncbi:NADP-dependent oxidoreductase [Acidisoma cellulosilytica]|uniref:NADP-dependent oxidoreductase n=1 Tax=Acidisoma cellulosilyticum TaxID=2802395 RepID=A0A963Z5Q1_9PROT|nr:NADP-dependent oxidoreductase [Acidisoma cellulosilyticum]MCB8883001.1 NADP-dependent oxidoreductase [Acidisoma cellulosilyticum]